MENKNNIKESVSFKKFSRVVVIFLNIVFLIVIFILIEFTLKSFAPFRIATIGHRFSENAKKYGWGFSPDELIKIIDPDTGEKYFSYANSKGWRDIDHQYDNRDGAYRILFLGDSITFGACVPAEKIYTRILEKRLMREGYNSEVITMAYGGFSTDQELEVLKNEGLKYKPNLIIVQFCTNDIKENNYFYRAVNNEKNWADYISWKPFYYKIDDKKRLHKKNNPHFAIRPKEKIRNFIHASEILKRIYATYLTYKFNNVAEVKYRVTRSKLSQLEMAVDLKKDSRLYKYLYSRIDKKLSFKDISSAMDISDNNEKTKEAILKILEDRWFNEYWNQEDYFPKYTNVDSYDWQLYLALVREIKKYADSINADMAVFPETEEGHYEWSLSWHRVNNDAISKINYLSHIQTIKSSMNNMGIGVIENTIPYKRTRNDPHPSIEGNKAMAEDIWKHLMFYKKKELDAYKKLKINYN